MAQMNYGELRLRVTDPSGLGVRTGVELKSDGSHYDRVLATDDTGSIAVKLVPYGLYLVEVAQPGFTAVAKQVEVDSVFPVKLDIHLEVATVATQVTVNDAPTLIDPSRPSSVMQIGSAQIASRPGSLPGRSVQDLVNSQPGWLYEGNAVLHPRGSEYQTQFVIDGIPLTDNRSPSFGPEIEADDVDSMTIYTAGFPAEFGRKMGGVVEINTKKDATAGLHGRFVLSGGSYDTATAYAQAQEVWGKNLAGVSATDSMTSHYLNPVVPENFTNNGTTGDFSARYERDLTDRDRLTASVRHELSRYEVPNEFVQQQAGQRQNGDNFETMGTAGYQHIFSSGLLGNAVGMVRDTANNLYSNLLSTPILASQHNDFREGYFKGTMSLHRGNQEWKAGVEADSTFLHEQFSYNITDPSRFDDGTPPEFAFAESRPDLEQSAFVEDLVGLGNWTVSAGLRWDHYQLLINRNAFSPRLSVSRYLPEWKMVLHASYDRVFQTPSFENILLSSSPQVTSLNPSVLRLPVRPSSANYYEGGFAKALAEKVRVDVNVFRRDVSNFADDDQLLNTGVSYPISFDRAVLYGADGKVELVHWGKLSGFASYSYIVGNAWFPVTGGLLLGDDVGEAQRQLTGHFPDSQDQRNTVRAQLRYQVKPRFWVAGGVNSGSGLPFDFTGTYEDALAQYGLGVVSRVNFDRGRTDPTLAVNASAAVDLYKSDKLQLQLQADGENLANRLNVIDFNGLFSGNAIGPGRSAFVRLSGSF